MKVTFNKTQNYLEYIKTWGNPNSLVCFEKGFHDVEPLIVKRLIPMFDNEFHWGKCVICNAIHCKSKLDPDEENPYQNLTGEI